jgi:heptosyltransferase I
VATGAFQPGLLRERPDGLPADGASKDLEQSGIERHGASGIAGCGIHARRTAVQRARILRAMLALPAPLPAAIESHGAGLTILIVRLGAMGDIVRTLPAVRLLRFGLPDARLHWVAWEPWTRLLKGHADLDGVIGLPRSELRALARSPLGWPSLAGTTGRIASRLRALQAGLVLDFHGDLRSGILGRLSGAPVRIGYDGHQQKEGNRLFTTHRVTSGDRRTPRLERNLDLVRALGLPVRPVPDAGLELGLADRLIADDIVAALVPPGGGYAVLGPGASRRQAYKKPPAALFAAAATALARLDIVPIVASGPGEDEDATRVVEASGGAARRAPPTSLPVLAALLHNARLFVGGDSGPLHLACGVGCPVVGLYGPTDPLVNTPWNVPFAALAPPGRVYTGVKSKDRAGGGFEGLTSARVTESVVALAWRRRNDSRSR